MRKDLSCEMLCSFFFLLEIPIDNYDWFYCSVTVAVIQAIFEKKVINNFEVKISPHCGVEKSYTIVFGSKHTDII